MERGIVSNMTEVVTPAYLYHYTNVDSLALILKNKNIQFRPLNTLDDLQEEKLQDEYKLARFVFVSSWTEEENESIPMWKMYSDWENGIRIKLPAYPFQEYEVTKEEVEEVTGEPATQKGTKGPSFIRPFREIYESGYTYMSNTLPDLLYRVEYTDNVHKLYPQVYFQEKSGPRIEFGKIGKTKSKSWKFQKEWRYKFECLPISMKRVKELKGMINEELLYQKLLNNEYQLPVDRFFLSLSDAAFSQMEITYSPKLTENNRIFIKLLKEKFNPSLVIHESALKDTIR
jgi:hypothetical protein